jgi:energy-coupling factor transporter ATP-binding protein EcfA2
LTVVGQDLSDPLQREAILGQVGIVFQSPEEQMVAATVEREIAFGLENMGIPSDEIRARVDGMLDRFSLTPYAKRSPHQLSGGEKQRLALASVLVMRPKLLILDEVTSLLDPAGRLEIRTMIREMRGLYTIILITQFPSEALVADRLVVIHDGKIRADAPPKSVFLDIDLSEDSQIDPPPIFHLIRTAACAENPSKK